MGPQLFLPSPLDSSPLPVASEGWDLTSQVSGQAWPGSQFSPRHTHRNRHPRAKQHLGATRSDARCSLYIQLKHSTAVPSPRTRLAFTRSQPGVFSPHSPEFPSQGPI